MIQLILDNPLTSACIAVGVMVFVTWLKKREDDITDNKND